MQKHKLLPALLALLLVAPVLGQNVLQRLSDHEAIDRGNAVEALPDGSVIVVGSFGAATETIWAQRINAQGNLVWSREYANRPGTATDVCTAADGSLLIIFNLQPPSGTPMGLAGWMKISPQGDVLSTRLTTTPAHLSHIVPTSDGYVVTGFTRLPNDFDQDAIALKIKENGDISWTHRWDAPGDDLFASSWVDPQGFVYCAGYAVNFAGNRDGVLAKLSPGGSLLWSRRYGGTQLDELAHVAPTNANGVEGLLVVGSSASFGSSFRRLWLLNTDRAGTVRSSKTYELPESNLAATDLLALAGNQFVASAADPTFGTNSPALLLRMADDGTLVWEYQYRSGGSRDQFRQVKPLKNGLAAVGTAVRNGNIDVFMAYLGSDGLLLECCPREAGVVVKNVVPEVETFVPNSTGLPSSTLPENWSSATTAAQITNPCVPIVVDFTLSDTLLRPGDCANIIVANPVPGVKYTLDLQGGMLDPMDSLRVCYPDCGQFFITRTGQSSVCKKSFLKIVDVGTDDDEFPNAFTPNGDMVNDRFRPLLACPPEAMIFEVFDRWGKKVFTTTDPKTLGWDGTLDGQPAPADVYAWRLEYGVLRGGERQGLTEKGNVTLLR